MIFKELSGLSQAELERLTARSKSVDTSLVEGIIRDVRERGDAALVEYTRRFDRAEVKELRVRESEFEAAWERAEEGVVDAIKKAHERILRFHEKQLERGFWYDEPGGRLGQILRPVENVGCYVPGGRAYYPSTVLMCAVPAKVAGARRVVVATPPRSDGQVNEHTLVACKIAGVDEVYKVGGAQAIAALAYGTESVPRVDMIVGPGNIYVTAAKKMVYGDVGVDMLAGPSEVLIIADGSADPGQVLQDLLAQAEHDPDAKSLLVSTDRGLLEQVKEDLEALADAPAAAGETVFLLARDLEEAARFSNAYAPEHLEILTSDDEKVLEMITNAGSIFLGPYSPVAAGDYASGPNHVLPTGGCARFQSGLNVGLFMKKISVQRLTRKGLQRLAGTITTLAEAEGLRHHSESVKERLGR